MLRRNSRTNKERFNDEETPFAEVTSPLGSRAFSVWVRVPSGAPRTKRQSN